MKKTVITVRIPIFMDLEIDLEDSDYEHIVEEWDRSNFGIVKSIVGDYIDLDNTDMVGSHERYGDTEIVDIKVFEEEEKESPIEQEENILDSEYNTITPKGKPN